jgi:hypothetical protein
MSRTLCCYGRASPGAMSHLASQGRTWVCWECERGQDERGTAGLSPATLSLFFGPIRHLAEPSVIPMNTAEVCSSSIGIATTT